MQVFALLSMPLTRKEQEILMSMLEKPLEKNGQKLYRSTAFYRTISHLKKNLLVKSEVSKNNKSMRVYILTFYGRILSRYLAGLPDSPKKYQRRGGGKKVFLLDFYTPFFFFFFSFLFFF